MWVVSVGCEVRRQRRDRNRGMREQRQVQPLRRDAPLPSSIQTLLCWKVVYRDVMKSMEGFLEPLQHLSTCQDRHLPSARSSQTPRKDSAATECSPTEAKGVDGRPRTNTWNFYRALCPCATPSIPHPLCKRVTACSEACCKSVSRDRGPEAWSTDEHQISG